MGSIGATRHDGTSIVDLFPRGNLDLRIVDLGNLAVVNLTYPMVSLARRINVIINAPSIITLRDLLIDQDITVDPTRFDASSSMVVT